MKVWDQEKCGDRPAQTDGLEGLDLAHGVLDGHLAGCLQPQKLLQVLLGRHFDMRSLVVRAKEVNVASRRVWFN